MKALIPKTDFKNDLPDGRSIYFKEKMVYIVPDPIIIILDAKFRQSALKPEKYFIVMPAEQLIRPYNGKEDNTNKTPVIVRSGGIGDLIALSSLTWYFDKTNCTEPIFICDTRFKDVFKWYWYEPKKVIDHFEPLCIYTPFQTPTHLRLINLDGICEQEPQRNWYEKFYERMNVIFEKPYGRPYLMPVALSGKSIVILNRASSFMRSIHLPVIINALNHSDLKKYRFLVFEQNLSDIDYSFLPNNFFIDKAKDIDDFLTTLYRSGKIISVDTAGIHFFEGTQKPGLGLYNSFTTESRTKYYTYTKSVDIQSTCDLQPCFLHDKKTGDQCPEMLPGETTAPCMGRLSNNIIDQLTEYLNQWKKTF